VVAELAARQWGVVSRAQLRELGASLPGVGSWVRRGRLHVLHRGVYAVGHAHVGREGHRLAAVLAGGPGAVLSHVSAAAHWGLLHSDAARIDVTAPRHRRSAGTIRLHRTRSLDAGDATTHQGIPITSVSRTLLDVAATLKPHRLERALAQAERLQLYDHRAIEALLARANGHRGRVALTKATAREPKLTRSDLEARFLELARQTTLPEPLANFTLAAPDHPRIEVDFYWPRHRLVVEIDGFESHGTHAAFKADRKRDAALQAAGNKVLRFTHDDVVGDPATVKRRLEAA
jgi:very-short-patch-repair endonuclease